jgi:hypothetical protein
MFIAVRNTRVLRLVVTSVSMFLFSCAVAVFSSSPAENILVAIAAYSAILVVFMRNGSA